MKKRVNEYLSGRRKGFSLVEIIITIAIMAILVGVIALAVIPNIARSHESKDLTKLDSIMASTNIAIANKRITESGWFEIGGASPAAGSAAEAVYNAVETELGDLTQIKMESGAAEGYNIRVGWIVTNPKAPHIVVQLDDGTVACAHTKGEPSDADGYQLFKVETGSGGDPFAS